MGGANLRPTKILKGKEMLSVFRIIGLALLLTALTFASSSVGGVQLVSNYTSVQVSTVSFYVNSVDFRPVPGQQCPFSVYYGGVLPQNLLAVVNPFPTAGAGAMDHYPIANPRGDDSIQLNQFYVVGACSWENTQILVSWLQTGQSLISQFTPYIRGLIYPSGSSGLQLCQSCALAQLVQFRQYRWNSGNVHVQRYVYPVATLAVLTAWTTDSRPVTDTYTITGPGGQDLINLALLSVSTEVAGDGVIVVAWA